MKRYFFFFLSGLVFFTHGFINDLEDVNREKIMVDEIKIKITWGDQVVTATMYDNPTTGDFISMLPITTSLEDYAGLEKIFYPERKLSVEGAPLGYDPSVGDITYYAPWGDVAIFYKDFGYAQSLISLGKIDEQDISKLQSLGEREVTIDLLDRK